MNEYVIRLHSYLVTLDKAGYENPEEAYFNGI